VPVIDVIQGSLVLAAGAHPVGFAAVLAVVLGACLMGVLSWGRALNERD
jgi:hypothetical protein